MIKVIKYRHAVIPDFCLEFNRKFYLTGFYGFRKYVIVLGLFGKDYILRKDKFQIKR
jgi:hypothetical protein